MIVAAPERAAPKLSAEEPVTAKIKRQMEAAVEDTAVHDEVPWEAKLTATSNRKRAIG